MEHVDFGRFLVSSELFTLWSPGLLDHIFAVHSFYDSCTLCTAVNRCLAEPALFVQCQSPTGDDVDVDFNDDDESPAW